MGDDDQLAALAELLQQTDEPTQVGVVERCLDLVERCGLTFLIGASTNLAMLAQAQQRESRDLSSLRGMAYFKIDVQGPKGDLHSGSYGGADVAVKEAR